MSKLNTEFFIARRLSKQSSNDRKNVMVRIATITVALSIAIMIISMAVISGFKSEITNKLAGFGAHVNIVNLDGNTSLETVPITRNPNLEEWLQTTIPNLNNLNTYAVKGGIIKTDQVMQGIMLKGVDGDYDWSFFESNLIKGTLPKVGDTIRNKDILISRSLARVTSLGVEDKVEMLFIQTDAPPRRDRFKVSGIYDSGLEEMDIMIIPTDIRNVQRLNGWDYNSITGYELTSSNFAKLDDFESDIYRVTREVATPDGESLMVVSVKERFPNLFDWLKAHNVNAAVIITIMLLVALLNMISALLIILLERTHMIGVLKALGMNNPSIQKIFVIRSGYIILRGMIWGNIIGVGVCLLQKYTHLIKLDQTGYFLSEVPIKLEWSWVVWLNFGTFALILGLLVIPTMVISRIKPDNTIRYR